MIRLIDRAAIPAAEERVWESLASLDAHYREWHPEHLVWHTLSGPPLTEGAIVFVDEWIGRFRLTGRCRIVDVRPNRSFRWEMLGRYALVGVGGSFALAPIESGTALTAEVHMGWSTPVLGWLLDRIIALVVPLPELRRHMADEGRNLARLLGAAAGNPPHV